MSRRRTPLALAWLVALLLVATGARGALVHGEGLLWQVRPGDGTTPSYVFGTIHSDREAVLDLAPEVERAFDGAARYAFELDFNRDIQARMAAAMFDRSSPPLSEQLTDDEWAAARRAGRERGLPPRALELMEPWALAVTLALPETDPRGTLDRVLYDRAQQRGLPVTGLETAQEQIRLFDRMDADHQLDMLRSVIDLVEAGRLDPMLERVVDAWLDGDVAAIVEIGKANPMLPDPEAEHTLNERLIEQRNARMARRIAPLIDRGGAFVAIGALHLPGEDGVLRLLEKSGYTVERMR